MRGSERLAAEWLALLLLGIVLAAPAAAQLPVPGQDSSEEAAPAEEPPPPDLIPISEIAPRSEALRRDLRRDQADLEDDATFGRVAEEIDGIEGVLARRAQRTRDRLTSRPQLSHLNDLQSEWSARRAQLDGWNAALAGRVEQLQREIDALAETRALWERSLDAAREESAPAELVSAVREDLRLIDAAAGEAKRERDRVLRFQADLAEHEATVTGMLELVEEARNDARERLFRADAPRIWNAVPAAHPRDGVWTRLVRSLRTEWTEFEGFVAEAGGALPRIVLVYALTAAAALWLRRRLRTRASGGRLEGAAKVFDRPFSVATLVVLIVALGSLPFAPLFVQLVLGIVLIVPVVRLVTPVVPTSVLPLLSAIVGFFLFDRLRELLEAVPLIERVAFLLETLVATLLIARLLRPARLETVAPEERPPELLGYGLRLGLALFAGATLANVAGLMGLARVLGEGTLAAVYAGLMLFALYRVATTSTILLLGSRHAQRLASVRSGGGTLVRWAQRVITVVLFAAWVVVTLQMYLVWDPVRRALVDGFTTPVTLGDLAIVPKAVATFALTVLTGWVLARMLRSIFMEDVAPHLSLARGVGNAIGTVTSYVVLIAAFLLAVAAAGLDLSSFAIIVGALSVGIGIGLQEIVNNFVSGLILLFERPVQVGDLVQVGTLTGHMTRIGIRSSTLLTFEGSEVILPNARLVSDDVVNWTLSNARRRVDVPVGVAYGSDHEQVLRVLESATQSVPQVLDDPAPFVVFSGFGDSALDFEVRFWVDAADFLVARTSVVAAIYAGLGEDGVEIPFPQRDLHLRSVAPELLARADGDGAVRGPAEGAERAAPED